MWATWCAPCLEAIDKSKELGIEKRQFELKIDVVKCTPFFKHFLFKRKK